ncbi:hypothetical protein Cantr_01784 [Candida viswanathii]|uniref:Leucine-rich repeat-containing protein 40 n=1 Tax=Candida viswanathii TaxID=5486 RepID=A0A367YJD3_9ASCO|nr:hypothetical protein Cantr_01784 [Candida viswanathii]
MGTFGYHDNSIEGDEYIQRLSTYIRKNEEALANGLLCFSKHRNTTLKVKPLRLSFTIHHLYYITERIEQSPLGVDVGPLNIKLDNPNHEPTFISFMANNARSSKHFESDTRSISSINSMKSIVSSASVYWRSAAISKDPKVINKDIKYLYSSFTKVPCLILSPKTKISSINSYEEYPCDTSVPVKMFKNLQVLEMVDYEPNEIFGWHVLSEQLRILIIRKSKISDMAEVLFHLVIDDESGRLSFNSSSHAKPKKFDPAATPADDTFTEMNDMFRYRRERGYTSSSMAASLPKDMYIESKDYKALPEAKWSFLKQLTVSESSITSIPSYIFKPLVNLVKLNLSNNLLEELPPGLDQLVNVKYINFADNYLTSLKNLPTNLTQLITLNFNNNKLEDLSGIEDIPALEKIDLRRNKLSSVKALKPLVVLFKNGKTKMDNIYLSQNNLAKNYRSELFNLFNGVSYKNYMKLDDSRPGYFEKAMLLDSEAAVKNLEKFLQSEEEEQQFQQPPPPPPQEPLPAPVPVAPVLSRTTSTLITKTTHNDDTLSEPFSQVKIDEEPRVKKFELSHTVISTSLSLLSTPTSPLHTNHNTTNKSPVSKPMTHLNNSNTSIPSSPSLKRSNTLVDIENSNTAPNIVTQVQVTARMST